jgi:hypothetical protein
MARLQLVPDRPRFEPPSRGPLLGPRVVLDRLAAGGIVVSWEWLKTRMPHKVTLSPRRYGWFEQDVMDWLESRRAS